MDVFGLFGERELKHHSNMVTASVTMGQRALEVGNRDYEFTSIRGAGHNLGNQRKWGVKEREFAI